MSTRRLDASATMPNHIRNLVHLHPAYGKRQVHPELEDLEIGATKVAEERVRHLVTLDEAMRETR